MKLARQKGLILSHPGEMGAPLRTDIKIKCHLLFPIQRFKGTKEARLVAGGVCVCVCVCVVRQPLSEIPVAQFPRGDGLPLLPN